MPKIGSPLSLGVAVTGTPSAVSDGAAVRRHFDEYGKEGVFIGSDGTTAIVRSHASSVDGRATAEGLETVPKLYVFNDSTWDRVRNNIEVTQLASAARTGNTNGPDQTNYNARGVIITLDVTTDPGGGETLQLIVEHKDGVSSAYEILLDDGANATPGRRTVIVYPGIGAAANDVTTIAGYPLPRTWRVRVVHSAGGTWNYSVGASLIL